MKEFYSNGKLLITGEYAVLDGAKALAIPTKFGQSLKIKASEEKNIRWKAFDENNKLWFTANYAIENDEIQLISNKEEVSEKLLQILNAAHRLNPAVFSEEKMGFEVKTQLNFNRNWGLGTSSTLINNIADWFKIDAYKLLETTFGGSGYDLAAAQNDTPVTYQITANGPSVLKADFYPEFSENIFFIYLNQKKNSRDAIAHYKALPKANKSGLTEKISSLTEQFITCDSLSEFELLINIHETLLSKVLKIPKVKQERFPDFPGAIKSLGGWGGDFVMVTGEKQQVSEYFSSKNLKTILAFEEMVL